MKWQSKTLLILAVGLIIFYLLTHRGCGGSDTPVMQSDTVYVMGTPDTLIVTDTVIKYVDKPRPYAVYVSTDTSTACDSIRVYENQAGKVTVRDSVRGELLSQRITSVQDTVFINRVDTMRITNTIQLERRFSLYAGAIYDNQLRPFIACDFKRTIVLAGYGLSDKSISVGLGYRLTK